MTSGTGQHPRTVLVCDDETAIRTLVAHRLRKEGFEVIDVRNGLEAYCCCDPSALPHGVTPRVTAPIVPAVVVTDLQMPVMHGMELAAKLKAFAPTSNVPVLMLTARGYILDQASLASTNIRAVMSKPFAGQHLVDKVRLLLIGDAARAA